MSCSRTTTQWRRWGSNPRPLGLESSTLPLNHWTHRLGLYINPNKLESSLSSFKIRSKGFRCFFIHTAKTLISLGRCPGWSKSMMGAQIISWFGHAMAQLCDIPSYAHQSKLQYLLFQCIASTSFWKKVRKRTKIRNQYNQAPHPTQDTNGKVTISQLDIANESQEVSPFPAGDHKAKLCSGPASRVHIVNVFTVDMKNSNKQEWNQIQISRCNL